MLYVDIWWKGSQQTENHSFSSSFSTRKQQWAKWQWNKQQSLDGQTSGNEWSRREKKTELSTALCIEWSHKHQIMNITKSKNYEQWKQRLCCLLVSASWAVCGGVLFLFFGRFESIPPTSRMKERKSTECAWVRVRPCIRQWWKKKEEKYAHTASMCTL